MSVVVQIAEGADIEVARALQKRIMRPNGPLPTDREPPDDWLQLVARVGDGGDARGADHGARGGDPGARGTIVGAARFGPSPWPRPDLADPPEPAWQLRSVAVVPEHRGAGVGAALVNEAQSVASAHGAATLWAEARVAALSLCRRLGWHTVGAEWDKPGVGPHRFVWIPLW